MKLARPFRLSALALAITSAAPAALAEAPRSATTTTASTRPAASLPRLVFFMNPGGAPCQMQDRILQEMAPELKGKAEVVYLKTTIAGDIAKFQQYGIRALPTPDRHRRFRQGDPPGHPGHPVGNPGPAARPELTPWTSASPPSR